MVIAQFTGVSLQNDYSCWEQFTSGSWSGFNTFSAYKGADPDDIG